MNVGPQRVLAALVLGVLACVDSTGPARDDYELPPPDSTLDPAALRVGEILYACNRWGAAGAPSVDRVLVDVFFGRRNATDPDDRPRLESLSAVQARGGKVLFQFAFPAARVRIDTREIPPLVDGGEVSFVRTVPDPRRYDWNAIVGFRRPLTPADSTTFVALGGRVQYVFQLIPAIAGDLPNGSLVTFRQMHDVEYAEAAGVGCIDHLRSAE